MLSLQNRFRIGCLLLFAVGCSEQQVTVEVPTMDIAVEQAVFNPDNAPTVEFDVPGMHCEHMCVPKVRKTLQEQPGVVDVQVDLESKVAVVAIDEAQFDPNSALEALAAEFADSKLRTDGPDLISPAENADEQPAPTTEESDGEET